MLHLVNNVNLLQTHGACLFQEDWISVNADTAEGFEPVMELHASEGPLRSLTILRGQQQPHNDQRRQIQVSLERTSLECFSAVNFFTEFELLYNP